ncbi:hypothetical protein ACYATP_00135 [Lactobacillaceae bacterium Melli_B4]
MELEDQFCKSLNCNYDDLGNDQKTINEFIEILDKTNYFTVLHDFITVFATDDFLTKILYDNDFYENFSLFLNEDVDNINSYKNYNEYSKLSDDDFQNQWFHINKEDKTISRVSLKDVSFIFKSLLSKYKEFNIN